MSKFNIGARVVFNQTYSDADRGDAGQVVSYSRSGCTLVTVRLNKGVTVQCFDKRLDLDTRADPTPKTHEFKVGDKGVTRDGRKYEVLAVFPQREKRVIADVRGEIRDFRKDGSHTTYKSGTDLLPPPPKTVTRYCNVNSRGEITGNYISPALARDNASHYAVLVAHPVTIELP